MAKISRLWSKPVIRNDTKIIADQKPRHELWFELFFDLFFVALLLKLGDVLKYCGLSSSSIFDVFLLFSICLETRLQLDLYINRFYSEDLLHKILFLLQFFGVYTMILNIGETSNHGETNCSYTRDYTIGLSIGFFITRMTLIIMYAVTMYVHEAAFIQVKYLVLSMFVSSFLAAMLMMAPNKFSNDSDSSHTSSNSTHATIDVLLSSSASSANEDDSVFGNENATYIWSLVFFVELLGWIFSCLETKIPLHVDDCRVRVGTFVMIVLGEAIIQVIYQTLDIGIIYRHYEFGFFGLLITLAFALQYFDASPHEVENHALTKSKTRGLMWFLITIPLCFSIFLVGASIKLLLYDLIEDHTSIGHYRLLSWSAFAAVNLLNIIRMLHKGIHWKIIIEKPKRSLSYAIRFVIAIAHVLVLLIPNSMDHQEIFLFYHFVIACSSVFVDIFVHTRKRILLVLSKTMSQRNLFTTSERKPERNSIQQIADKNSELSITDNKATLLDIHEEEEEEEDLTVPGQTNGLIRLSSIKAKQQSAHHVVIITLGKEGLDQKRNDEEYKDNVNHEVHLNEDHPISYGIDDEYDDEYDGVSEAD